MAYAPSAALTGLRPVTNVSGTSPRVNEYTVSASYGTAIGEGCVLIRGDLGVILARNLTCAALSVIGVAAQNLKALPGAGATIKVYDDPNQEYYARLKTNLATGGVAERIKYVSAFVKLDDNTYGATLGYGKTQISTSVVQLATQTNNILQIRGWPGGPNQKTAAAAGTSVIVRISPAIHRFHG